MVTSLSLLINPILGLITAILLIVTNTKITNRMTIEKVRRNLADGITNLEHKLKDAEDKKDHDKANKFRRAISKLSLDKHYRYYTIRLQIIDKRIEKMEKKEQELKEKKEMEGVGR